MAQMDDINHKTNILFEREVQTFLAKNLQLLGNEGLVLVQTEYPVSFSGDQGRIDILAKDSAGRFIVIEVKRGVASRGAIAQLQSYMGAISDEYPRTEVKGILVSMGIDGAAEAALRMTQNISAFHFETQFKFSKKSEAYSSSLPNSSGINGGRAAVCRENYWESMGGRVTSDALHCRKCEVFARIVQIGGIQLCGACGASTT